MCALFGEDIQRPVDIVLVRLGLRPGADGGFWSHHCIYDGYRAFESPDRFTLDDVLVTVSMDSFLGGQPPEVSGFCFPILVDELLLHRESVQFVGGELTKRWAYPMPRSTAVSHRRWLEIAVLTYLERPHPRPQGKYDVPER